MAPWPEQSNEPKAPDKASESDKFSEIKCAANKLDRSQSNEGDGCFTSTKTNDALIEEKNPCVLSLDEGQLKALLDEALAYKNPVDREGKSDLFKELLEEAEADDKEDARGGGGVGGGVGVGGIGIGSHSAQSNHYHSNYRRSNRSHRRDGATTVGERQLRGGSLQNIHAFSYELEGGRKRGKNRRHDGGGVNVSARQREGGSLPNNVDHVPQPDHLATAAALMLEDLHPLLPITLSQVSRRKEMPIASETLSAASNYVVLDVNSSNACDVDTSIVSKQKSGVDDVSCGIELQELNQDKSESVCYTSRATLEICEHSVNNSNFEQKKSNSIVVKDSSEVDLPVVFSLNKNYGLVNGRDKAPVQLLSSSNNPLKAIVGNDKGSTKESNSANSNSETGAYSFSMQHVSFIAIPPHESSLGSDVNRLVQSKVDSLNNKSKPFDENGNALGQPIYRDAISERKKARRAKVKNDHDDTILAENIEGHRGDRDINSLLKFIEAGGEGKHGNKNGKLSNGPLVKQRNSKVKVSREKSTDGETLSRGTKSKRSKEKLKKSNSLEEISKTKLEDLTNDSNCKAMPKKQTTLDDDELGERQRRILPEEDTLYIYSTTSADECASSLSSKRRDLKLDRSMENLAQDSEFHVVTKKQRRKKRRSISNDRNTRGKTEQPRRNVGSFPPHDGSSPFSSQSRQISPEKRRKSTSSMPPSDKSDCSDLDSVHSLPVSSTTPKCQVQKTSTSNGSTPQASYADIARSTISPPQGSTNNMNGRWPSVSKSISSSPSSSLSLPNSSSLSGTLETSSNGGGSASMNGKWRKSSTAPSSVTSSSVHEEIIMHPNSPDLVPSVTLPLKHKKDATTSTSCDLSKLEPICNNNLNLNLNGGIVTDENAVSVNSVNNKITSAVSRIKTSSSYNSNVNVNVANSNVNELYVEFTLKPSETNRNQFEESVPVTEVSCEETVILKSPPKCNSETVSGSLTILIPNKNQKEIRSASSSVSSLRCSSLPPVILLDEELNRSNQNNSSLMDSELTFGFEVNEQLLKDSVSPPPVSSVQSNENEKTFDVAVRFQQPVVANISYNYEDIIIFIEKAWADVQKEFLSSKTSDSNNTIEYFSSNQ